MLQAQAKPRLRSLWDWGRLVLCGICMGAADIVPGISGGTMAFIMGFYEDLLTSIKSLNTKSFALLFSLKFRQFRDVVAWEFLLALLAGISFSFIVLCHGVSYVLGHEVYRVYLYAAFSGLILASVVFCAKLVKTWEFKHVVALLVGGVIAFIFTDTTTTQPTTHYAMTTGIDWWIVCCGAIAISAMLLPGISGSYLLTVLGTYPIVILALADFVSGLKQWHFDFHAFQILASMAIGIAIGAMLFSRVVTWLLHHYREITIASLTGFMIGAFRSVWPFWSYHYVVNPLRPERGAQLQPLEMLWPDISSLLFWQAIAFAITGFALVFLIEYIAVRKS